MNIKKNITLTLFYFSLMLVFTKTSFSQGGSNYSILGFGDINQVVSASYEGLAGTAIAIPSSNSINIINPALISLVTDTRLQVGYNFNQNIVTTTNSNLWQNNGGVNGINALFALDTTAKVSVALGLIPASKVNYLVAKSFIVPYNNGELHGTSLYKGSGGLSSLYLALGANVVDNLYLGANIFGNFGSINYNNTISYLEDYTFTNTFNQQDYFSGFGYKFGLFYQFPFNFNIGAYYSNYGTIKVDRAKSYSSDLLNDTTFTESLNVNPPSSFGIGISYQTGKFLIGADWKVLNISNLNYGFSLDNKFKNSNEVSIGAVRFGNTMPGADYADRITYRFGAGYNALYYEIANTNINEINLSVGASFPIGYSGLLDVAAIFGQRGTTNNGLLNEYYSKLVIDFSIGEGWFHPYKREY
jgi:hypothetical protein